MHSGLTSQAVSATPGVLTHICQTKQWEDRKVLSAHLCCQEELERASPLGYM